MKIEKMKLITGAGALIAKFDIVGNAITIRGMGIFRKADGSSWISEPSSKIEKRDGSVDYWKHVLITDDAVRDNLERQAKERLAELELAGSEPGSSEDIPF